MPTGSSESYRSDIAPQTKGFDQRVLSRYLGDQLTSSQPNPHDRLNYGSRNLPDMFRGRRLQLQDSVEGFILNGYEFYTFIIPWLVTNEKSVKMNVYRHNVRPAGPTPNKGVSRSDTHQTFTKEATVERFGKMFTMEGDLMGTPEGDRQYIRNLMGLAQGCQLMVNQATMTEIIDCKNYVRDWMEYRGRRNWVEDVMEQEVARFAGMAASVDFLEQAVQASISAFNLRSITADAIIGWENLPFLDSMVNRGTRTAFWQLGPDGRDVFVAGPDAVTSIKGLPLFLARPFVLNEDNGPTQFLARDTTVGEYYPMAWDERLGEYFGPGGSVYTSDQREIRIYDILTDSMRAVTLKEAIAHSQIWDPITGAYDERLVAAVREANIANSKQNGFDNKARRYGDMRALDLETGFTRTENMFFAHAVESKLMYLPVFMGQFDTDVIHTDQLVQAADQLLASALKGQLPTVMAQVNIATNFLARWEAEAGDNNAFFDAVISLNAPKSINPAGQWVGERLTPGAPRDWVPNSKGSLDIPAYDSNAYGEFPAGFANEPGLQTVVATPGVPQSTISGARQVLDTVAQVTAALARFGKISRFGKASMTPEWFHNKKPETVTFELLFGRRSPIFLAAPQDEVENGTAEGDGIKKDASPKYNEYTRQYQLIGALPTGALLAKLIGVAVGDNSETQAIDKFNSVVTPNNNNNNDDATNRQEQIRSNVLTALLRRALKFATPANADKKYRLVYALRDIATDLKLGEPLDLSAFAALDVKFTNVDANKKQADYDAKYAKLSAFEKSEIDTRAEKAYFLGVADVESVNLSGPLPVAQKEQLRQLLVPVKGSSETMPLTALAEATENVERLGRKYGGFSWSTMEKWATSVAANIAGDKLAELANAIDAYQEASRKVNSVVDSVLATGADGNRRKIAVDDDDDEPATRTKGPKQTGTRRFFRSPLTMTRHLLYTSSDSADPRIRPADPATNFRTMFYPDRNPGVRYEDHLFALGQMPHMLDVGDRNLHQFHTSSLVMQSLLYPAVEDEAAGYEAPDSFKAQARKGLSSQSAMKRKADDTLPSASASTKLRRAPEKPQMTAMQAAQMQMLRAIQRDDDEDHDDKFSFSSSAMPTGPRMGVGMMSTGDDASAADPAYYGDALSQRPQTTEEYQSLMAGGILEYRWTKAMEYTGLQRLAMLYIIMSDASLETQRVFVDHNISPLFNVMIWRPQITIGMYSLIVLRSGLDTGANIIGDRNFAMQDSVTDKVMEGHLTFYHKCVIWKDQHIDHLLDIYPQKYRMGWDMSWIEKPEELNGNKKNRGSLMAWIHPLGETVNKTAVSLIGGDVSRTQPYITNNHEPSTSTALTSTPYYSNYVWKINRARTVYNQDIATFKKSREQINVLCYAGKYIGYDKSLQKFVLKTNGTGHLAGVKSGPQTRAIWTGQSWSRFPQAVAV